MSDFFGILELIFWIVSVVGIAAGITYAVIRLAPKRGERAPTAQSTGDS